MEFLKWHDKSRRIFLLSEKAYDLSIVLESIDNKEKNLVYSGSKENVKLTMVNGSILYEDGLFSIGEDPEEIYAKANEIIRKYRA